MTGVTDVVVAKLNEARRNGRSPCDVRPWGVNIATRQDHRPFSGPQLHALERCDTVDRSQGVRPARNRVRRQAAFNGCHKAARNGRYRSPSDGPGVVMSSDLNKHQKVGEGVMVASVEPAVRVKVRDKLRVAMRPSRLHVFEDRGGNLTQAPSQCRSSAEPQHGIVISDSLPGQARRCRREHRHRACI
jgi:hypothetical protein